MDTRGARANSLHTRSPVDQSALSSQRLGPSPSPGAPPTSAKHLSTGLARPLAVSSCLSKGGCSKGPRLRLRLHLHLSILKSSSFAPQTFAPHCCSPSPIASLHTTLHPSPRLASPFFTRRPSRLSPPSKRAYCEPGYLDSISATGAKARQPALKMGA